jgi:hypothetical protein
MVSEWTHQARSRLIGWESASDRGVIIINTVHMRTGTTAFQTRCTPPHSCNYVTPRLIAIQKWQYRKNQEKGNIPFEKSVRFLPLKSISIRTYYLPAYTVSLLPVGFNQREIYQFNFLLVHLMNTWTLTPMSTVFDKSI